jgi:hypothetical protein
MRCRGTLFALVCVLLLGLPGNALAQSAGDNQYQDPFAGQSPSSSQPKQAPSGGGGGGGNAGASAGTTAQAAPADPSATASQSQQQAGATLPRTGFNATLPLVYGLVLLLSGVALRRGARPRIQ